MTDQKSYPIAPLTSSLRSAREAKGLTQRALASLTKIPQSHLSKIETGSVNLQLSSLLELARELDLELMLVPRRLVPAVEALTRNRERTSPSDQTASWALPELTRIANAVRALQGTPKTSKYLQEISHAAKALEAADISSRDYQIVRRIADMLGRLKSGPDALPDLKESAKGLRTIRNAMAHRAAETPTSPRPAYTLNDEDDDA
jgi:transcriptional regulator with XRE-family HTH domain